MRSARPRSAQVAADANKLLPEDQPVHDWYRFVLSFPPQLVREYLRRFAIKPGQVVLDPFCGTGTVLVECKKLAIPAIGVEAHPMAHFASRVKVDWDVDPQGLAEGQRLIAQMAADELAADDIDDLLQLGHASCDQRPLRRLPEESHRLLLRDSISPLPLHKALVLRDCITADPHNRYRDHQLLALARSLYSSIGNLHFGPEVGVSRPKQDAPVLAPWAECVKAMAVDIRALASRSATPATVYRADSREPMDFLPPGSVHAVITSPPYPNEKDYTRITRLESVLLGFIRNRAELRALKRRLVRSNTRNVYKGDDDDAWVSGHPEIQRLADEIEARRVALGKTSGFERLYPAVTKLYFGGMKRHLADLRRRLRPGAHLAYVVGDQASYLRVMIRTGRLLAQIAESLGYHVVNIDLFRTRLATATKEQLREEVLILRWPGPREGVPPKQGHSL